MNDERIVYGANCCWWDSIEKAGQTLSGLPGCPFCGSPLFEMSILEWYKGIDEHEKNGEENYRKIIDFMRGKCFKTFASAKLAYDIVSNRGSWRHG